MESYLSILTIRAKFNYQSVLINSFDALSLNEAFFNDSKMQILNKLLGTYILRQHGNTSLDVFLCYNNVIIVKFVYLSAK